MNGHRGWRLVWGGFDGVFLFGPCLVVLKQHPRGVPGVFAGFVLYDSKEF